MFIAHITGMISVFKNILTEIVILSIVSEFPFVGRFSLNSLQCSETSSSYSVTCNSGQISFTATFSCYHRFSLEVQHITCGVIFLLQISILIIVSARTSENLHVCCHER